MSWVPQFAAWQYALAGMICAAGPVVIHLLNRRRSKTIHWGAMELLREAMTVERRVLRFRDLLLLALRVAAVALFGLALARPTLTGRGGPIAGDMPRHLILLIDNSLSMSYQTAEGTLLDRAKELGARNVHSLPKGSLVSVVSLVGQFRETRTFGLTKPDAIEALRTIEVVDGVSRLENLDAVARSALGKSGQLADQLVLISDRQRVNWPDELVTSRLDRLPKMLVQDVSVPRVANAWLEDLRLSEPILGPHSEIIVYVTVRSQSSDEYRTQATLSLNGHAIVTRRLSLPPGDVAREVSFRYDVEKAPSEIKVDRYAELSVSLDRDRLPTDDRITTLMPVIDQFPVVFVDQIGAKQERVGKGVVGETWPMRHLVAPLVRGEEGDLSVIKVEHTKIADVNRSLLADARLVVIAGVKDPDGYVQLLREYVEQGGPVLIAAGGEFDCRAWRESAWLNGRGLLAGPLEDEIIGVGTGHHRNIETPLRIDAAGIPRSSFLRLPGVSDEELRQLYSEPVFLKAVSLRLDDSSNTDLFQAEVELIHRGTRHGRALRGAEATATDTAASSPSWLRWTSPCDFDIESSIDLEYSESEVQTRAREAGPRVQARFAGSAALPLITEHRVGRGRVVFFASGFSPEWGTIAQSNAIVMLDRIARELILGTLSGRSYLPCNRLVFELPGVRIGTNMTLQRPGNLTADEIFHVGPIGKRRVGVVIPDVLRRGIYRLVRNADGDAASGAGGTGIRTLPGDDGPWRFAIDGDSAESDLTRLRPDEVAKLVSSSKITWLSDGEGLPRGKLMTKGGTWWRTLLFVVLVLLFMELCILAWP